jgi:Family of unknown function (DUF6152)
MRARLLSVLVGVSLWISQTPTYAHHAFSAEFDAAKPIMLTGTVAKVAWTNPHAHIHVDVTDRAGKVTTWDFELGSPNALMRRGWSARSLKPGDHITVSGYLAKDGSSLANARSITLADGHELFAGSSNEPATAR